MILQKSSGGAGDSQIETIGPYREFEEDLQALEWSPSDVHCIYCNREFHGVGIKYGMGVKFQKHMENCSKLYNGLTVFSKDGSVLMTSATDDS